MIRSQSCQSRALSLLNTFSAKWSEWDHVHNFWGRNLRKVANKCLRNCFKASKFTANKRMCYASIISRWRVKFISSKCDLDFIKERTEAIRKFRFWNVTVQNGTLVFWKQLASQPIQLLAWIALWQFLALTFTFSRKNHSLFFSFFFFQFSLFYKNLSVNS